MCKLKRAMFQKLGGRFGSLILGDNPASPAQVAATAGQGSASASGGMGERPTPQPADGLMSKWPSPIYEGVPRGGLAMSLKSPQ